MRFLYLSLLAQALVVSAVVIPTTDYITVKHDDHPEHKLLLKHNGVGFMRPVDLMDDSTSNAMPNPAIEEVCPGATPGHTGYLIAGTKHFFFAFFESRSAPATDPLVLWTNGGPGCSGFIGLITEHGPCSLQEDGSAIKNEHSWVNKANMIYIEQPLGVGYSYDSNNMSAVNTTWMAANDLLIFLDLWYSHFPEHRKNQFHLSGESYAGHYLPIFAKTILNHNDVSHAEDKIPLESIIIGNGQYDVAIQETTYYNMSCTAANGLPTGPVLDQETCKEMETYIQPCQKIYPACETSLKDDDCQVAFDKCLPHTQETYLKSHRSVYDIRVTCVPGKPCNALDKQIADYMNNPKVQAAFGATDVAASQWQMCNDKVFDHFLDTNDFFEASAPVLRELLDKNFKVLIYHGVYDVICNYIGAEQVLHNLGWHGLDAFNKASDSPITWSGGKYWEAENLRYTRVNDAGHFVPTSQPKAALELFEAWLEKRPMH